MRLDPGKKAVVIGLGASGMAAVRYLHAFGLEVAVSEAGPRDTISGEFLAVLDNAGIVIETGGHTQQFIAGADLVVPSPGVPLDLPVFNFVREKGIMLAGELALAAGNIEAPVIAVTGSNGKTTVTSLIGHLLHKAGKKVFVGGNIGTPVLEYLRGEQWAEVVVLEVSSFQLEIGGDFRPDIGLLLNISPDHLDRHGTMERYAAAKMRLFCNQHPDDVAILPTDDPQLTTGEIPSGKVMWFGMHPDADAQVTESGVNIKAVPPGAKTVESYDLRQTALHSFVNRLNAAAAILAVRALGCAPEEIKPGLADYMPPAHRMTPVAEINGVRYVDDSKGTNIGAVQAALASSGDRVILIAGGRDKKSDFSLLEPAVRKHVRHLVLIGEAADRMEEALGSAAAVDRAGSMAEAVRLATEKAKPGDTVLLSPGCASFDMFSGYAQRGDAFCSAVRSLEAARLESIEVK